MSEEDLNPKYLKVMHLSKFDTAINCNIINKTECGIFIKGTDEKISSCREFITPDKSKITCKKCLKWLETK